MQTGLGVCPKVKMIEHTYIYKIMQLLRLVFSVLDRVLFCFNERNRKRKKNPCGSSIHTNSVILFANRLMAARCRQIQMFDYAAFTACFDDVPQVF